MHIAHVAHMNYPTCTSINPHKYQGREKHLPTIENTFSKKTIAQSNHSKYIAFYLLYFLFSLPLSLSISSRVITHPTPNLVPGNKLLNAQPVTRCFDLPDFPARFEGY